MLLQITGDTEHWNPEPVFLSFVVSASMGWTAKQEQHVIKQLDDQDDDDTPMFDSHVTHATYEKVKETVRQESGSGMGSGRGSSEKRQFTRVSLVTRVPLSAGSRRGCSFSRARVSKHRQNANVIDWKKERRRQKYKCECMPAAAVDQMLPGERRKINTIAEIISRLIPNHHHLQFTHRELDFNPRNTRRSNSDGERHLMLTGV
jgi:hypothetical protein